MGRADILKSSQGFNPTLLYSQDSELLFRLAMTTKFCYVNRPLVLFDRAPVEDRHVGVSSEWNKMDFFLRDSQMRLEGLSRLTKDQPAAIRQLIRRQLGSIHSGWVNCYLQTRQYRKARAAAVRATTLNPTMPIALKSLLTWVSPPLALRLVMNREAKKASAFSV
jgi:hypothetical protein